MINIREIDHVVLRARDAEAMLAFYCGALGCAIEKRNDDIGLIQLRAGRSMIDIVPVDGKLGAAGGAPPGPDGRNMDHLCLRVEPFVVDDIIAQLKANGARVGEIGSRRGAEGVGPSIYVYDPEGNMIELKGPSDS